MKLSIIVPVYNMAAHGKLEYCLDSLVNQTISDYEIIAVDDASTDNSVGVIQWYVSQYPGKVRLCTYLYNKRQGGAKNDGLKLAKGEWIGFVDSDDWITPDYYEKLLAKAEETGADMVGCDYSMVEERNMEVGKVVQNNTMDQTGVLDDEKHKKLILRTGSMVVKIYRHSVIKENKLSFPEGIFYEDNCAGPLWSMYFNHFERVEEPLYYYFQHEVSTVHHISEEKCRDRMKAEEIFYKECEDRDVLDKYYNEIEYRFTELYYVNTLFSYMLGVKHPKLKFIKELRRKQVEYFPDFATNSYFMELTGEEEKRFIALQQKSDFLFYWYYRIKWAWRRMRKRLGK